MNKEFQYEGSRIRYQSTGKGNTVLLIHGFGEDGNVWKDQVEFLKDTFHLLVPDLPGSGGSERIADMSVEGMAEVIKIILNREGVLLTAMIGHSMGGYVALAFAKKYPDHLNALGLFHSTAYADSEEKKAVRRKGIDFINQHGAFEFLKTTIPNLFAQSFRDQMAGRIGKFIETQHNFSVRALVSYYEAMIGRPDRTEILRNATIPVLFIMGKHDTAIPFTDGLKQCHLPQKSYIHVLRQSGHMGMF